MSQKFLAYHLGVHGALAPKVNNYLKQNRSNLLQEGIFAPLPELYRPYCRDFIWGRGAFFKQQREMLELIESPQIYRGICMSNNQALSPTDAIWSEGEFLKWAETRVEKLATIFADHRLIFMLEIENFGTFLPRHLEAQVGEDISSVAAWPLQDFMWTDLVEGIQQAAPDAEVVIVPTEGMVRRLDEVIDEFIRGPLRPRHHKLQKVTADQLEAFQLAIGAGMAEPMSKDRSDLLSQIMGWDQETRIALSRQYYSEVLRLCHTHHVLM